MLTFASLQEDLGVVPPVLVERFDPQVLQAVMAADEVLREVASEYGELVHTGAKEHSDPLVTVEKQRVVLVRYALRGGPQGAVQTPYFR